MKRLIRFVSLVTICSAETGHAADLGYRVPPAKAPSMEVLTATSWAGPYLGVQAGYVSGRSETSLPATGEFHFADPKGASGGMFGGFNQQWGRLVAGIEGDISFVDANGRVDIGLGPDPSLAQLETKMEWNGHVRGRLGYGFDSALVYVAGGLAVAGVENRAIDNVSGATASWKGTRTGWSIGGGVDWRLTRAATVRVEYIYDNYGKTSLGAQSIGAVTFADRDSKLDTHTLRAGLGWKF
ncbi:outer membrane protein [Rhodopseudomonas sp. B29]|uniref:outer membrane protein n=1 Tax=Rhodopseudomonas sp. B29 TaxID=95607 RepID=UPI00034AB965|nr:outer membrane beta-barrel protein [Rhodopseudomonas sp. B29]